MGRGRNSAGNRGCDVNDRQELIRRFAVAIAGAHHISEYLRHEIPHDMVWRIADFLADNEPPQPQPQPEHTREDWAEVQGNVTRLTKDVHRLSGAVESLEARIQRAVALLRGATRYDTAAGFVVTEDRVYEAVQILEEGSDD
jgi:hypothetical protein